ncbi:MAG: phosphate/phosphite/phosphonate ABC transporter substrate-binding protein [Desulfosarcinaceae bacterium]|nr:phosphate/phosphite/phosphonate ABC transporter substrate-binding protein [Desulfosarcinaceae bacterium]
MPNGIKLRDVSRWRHLIGVIACGLLGLQLMWAGSSAAQTATESDRGHTLVIGHVSENPKKLYQRLKPMATYTIAKMDDVGIRRCEVLIAKDNRQMISYLRQGRVDWVTDTPFSAILYEEKAGAEILLKKWKKGVGEYHTVLFCRRESAIQTLHDLVGRTIALEDPGSTSAYLVPAALLLREGLQLALLASPRERPPADMVGYAFSQQEINTSTWVYRGLADAGAFSNLDWRNDDHSFQTHRQAFRIFHRSKAIPRAIELVRGDLDPAIKSRLKAILLAAPADPDAAAALKAYQKTTKFEALDAADLAGLAEIRALTQIVQRAME